MTPIWRSPKSCGVAFAESQWVILFLGFISLSLSLSLSLSIQRLAHGNLNLGIFFLIFFFLNRINLMNNARDTTNFTTKYLQTDIASYVEDPHQQLKTQLTINI